MISALRDICELSDRRNRMVTTPTRPADAIHQVWTYGTERLPTLPRHGHLREAERRRDVVCDSRSRKRSRGQLPRHRRRLSHGRRRGERGSHGRDPRALAEGQTRPLHRRNEGRRADGTIPLGPGRLPQAPARRHRWFPPATGNGLRRSLPTSPRRPSTSFDESLEALDAIVRSGKARYVGVSNILAYRLARALGRSDVLRLAKFASVQPRYSLLFREIERELLPLAL